MSEITFNYQLAVIAYEDHYRIAYTKHSSFAAERSFVKFHGQQDLNEQPGHCQ